MKKKNSQFISPLIAVAKFPTLLLCLFLFNVNNIQAQAKQCSAPGAQGLNGKQVDANHVSFQHVIGEELNVISPPPTQIAGNEAAKGGEKKYFDNGYIRYELTGNTEKDAEIYKMEKEKLFNENPELYKKWINESAGSTIEKNAQSKPQSVTKQ